jgi:predicted TIM-barrel fold metal-dependent hydrolase
MFSLPYKLTYSQFIGGVEKVPFSAAAFSGRNAMAAEQPKIDVHHHIVPPEYVSALAGIGVTEVGTRPFPAWDPESTLEVMDRYGIRTAVASISAPGVYFGDEAFARGLSRRCNEFCAGLIGDYPGRFGAFAVLPLPDVDAALEEVEYALDVLHLDGVALLTSVDGRYPGDPLFDDLYDELDRREAVVFLHPDAPPEDDRSQSNLPPAPLVEYVFETTRAVANLLFTGTLERCPHVRFILPHAGGTVPFVALRLCLGQFWPGLQESVPQGVFAYLQRLYYDTALSAAPSSLRSLQELVDTSHILFACDFPFATELATMATIEGLKDYDGFDQAALEAVFYKNALALFPRIASAW